MGLTAAGWSCTGGDTVSSPYVTCWLFGETYCLKAITPQNLGGYTCTFHHWTHLDRFGGQIGDDFYYPEWRISVPAEYDYHRYLIYFSGGPYSAQVVSPNGWEIWHVGEQRIITWNVSPGADSTTYVDVFLDRNGRNDGYPEQILDGIPGGYHTGWDWMVNGPVSVNCRIKVVAYDRAGNSDWDVSNLDFSIKVIRATTIRSLTQVCIASILTLSAMIASNGENRLRSKSTPMIRMVTLCITNGTAVHPHLVGISQMDKTS